ncbi:MAG: glycosyltransferase family 29 protein [Acidobacteria bacterium]|nr:glycosyltransferase family 29 protein [Acidobacteriota bacterium]
MDAKDNSFRAETDSFPTRLAQLELDLSYQELLTGKTVVVVGPSQTLLGTRQGRMIDAYDLVVRFNDAIKHLPFTNELAEDIGSRLDILYCNNDILVNGILGQNFVSHERFAQIANQMGIKWILSTNNNFSYELAATSTYKCFAEEQEFRGFLIRQNVSSQFNMLFSLPDLMGKWLGGYVGMTGFLALADLLRYDIARLHIVGMTFYHRGGHLFPRQSANDQPRGVHPGEPPTDETRGHNSYAELEVMKTLARHFQNKLMLDAELQMLLEEDLDSRASL